MGISINFVSLLTFGPLLAAALPQASSPLASSTPRSNATVLTQSGTVTGHPAKNATTVSEFLGIPYAQPPIGDLRFAAPASYNSTRSFQASAFSPDCPQQGLSAPPIKYPGQTPQFPSIIDSFAGGRGNPQSEDCLTLNIWTKRAGSSNKTAVLLWLHGGRFTIGDSNTPFYDGEFLSESQDIVVVTINYRLNVFGFSTAPGQPKNVGLLDQRKAIEWVRDNIAGFGGDPGKITVMGQSAGGSAVDYYAYAYAQDPIVAGLISDSGTAESFAANTPEYSAKIFSQAAQSLNCTGDSDEKVLTCMRKVSYKDLLATNKEVTPLDSDALPQPPFHPTVDNITVFNLDTYRSRGQAGRFAPIPYMAGNNDKEDGFYRLAALGAGVNLTEAQWTQYDLQGFTCASAAATGYRSARGIPSWHYRYFATFANTELYPGSGAYHGSDLHMIFGNSEGVTGIPESPLQTSLKQYMMNAWGAFIKDPSTGLARLNWPNAHDGLIELGLGARDSGNAIVPAQEALEAVGRADAYSSTCPTSQESLKVRAAQGAF